MDKIDKAIKVLKILNDNQYQAYIVGGAVRNYLSGEKINDIDITTDAKVQELKLVFNDIILIHEEYGSVTIKYEDELYEITTFRHDGEYERFRKPKSIQTTSSIEEDVKRRDFTINGLYMDKNKEVYDLVLGTSDLKNNLLKTIGDPIKRFNEDALRMLRAIRFVSQYGFDIEENTLKAIDLYSRLVKNIAVERTQKELILILKGKYKKKAIEYITKTSMYKTLNFDRLKSLEIRDNYSFELCLALCIPEDILHKNYRFTNKITSDVRAINNLINNNDSITLFNSNYKAIELASEYLGSQLIEDYNNLIIKDRKEINLSIKEMVDVVNIKSGPWITKMINLIIFNILNGTLKNNKNDIKKFVLNNYKNTL